MGGSGVGVRQDSIFTQITDMQTLPLLWRQMTRFFAGFGYRAVSYYSVRAGSNQPAILPLHRGFRRDEIGTYLAFDFRRLDIVPRVTLAAGVPLRWADIWRTARLTSEEREFRDALRAVHFSDGVSLPCYGPNGRNATVGLAHARHGDAAAPPEPDALWLMHFAAQAAHLRICSLFASHGAGDPRLSRREKEILDWVARGKSNNVIAEILAISPGTVGTYIQRIYGKLDVSDRTSAAVKAVGMGLIAA